MVLVADVVCEICGKSHTSGTVSVVPWNSQLPPVCDRGESINCIVAER